MASKKSKPAHLRLVGSDSAPPEPSAPEELARNLDRYAQVLAASGGRQVLGALLGGGADALLDTPYSEALTAGQGGDPRLPSALYYLYMPSRVTFREFLERQDNSASWAGREVFKACHPIYANLAMAALLQPFVDGETKSVIRELGLPPSSREELDSWGERAGLGIWLDAPASAVLRASARDRSAAKWFEVRGEDPLREALLSPAYTGRSTWPVNSPKIPRIALEALRVGLLDLAARRRLAERIGGEFPWPTQVANPEATPRLQRLLDRVGEGLRRHREAFGPLTPLLGAGGELTLQIDPPAARWRPGWMWTRRAGEGDAVAFTPLHLEQSLEIELTDSGWASLPLSPPSFELLDALARWLAAPLDEVHPRVEADLGLDPIDRLLGDLMSQEPLELGLELRTGASGVWITLLRVETNEKGRVKLVTQSPGDLDLARVEDEGAQAAVLALCGEAAGSDLRPSEWKDLQYDPDRMASALYAGRHLPHLYVKDGRREPLRVRVRALELAVSEQDTLRLDLRLDGVALPDEALGRLARHRDLRAPVLFIDFDQKEATLVRINAKQRELAAALLHRGRSYQLSAGERVLDRLGEVSRAVPVALDPALRGRAVDGDPRLVVRMEVLGVGLRVGLHAQPIEGGALLPPGQGAELIYGRQGPERVHVQRVLSDEARAAGELVREVELGPPDDPELPFLWTLDDPSEAGRVLGALKEHDGVRLTWRGNAGRVRRQMLGLAGLSLSLKPLADWFSVEGEVAAGKARVSLAELLVAAESGRRFVALGEGDWAELDQALVEALNPLAAAMRTSEDGASIGALHAGALQGLAEEGVSLDAPPEWLDAGTRLREAADLKVTVPSGLQAELRPYQEAGFAWMARLAHWGPGAVLADDMGLGKTVQALALLLRRAEEGPALVIAPASVGFNWAREAERFAPSLRVQEYSGAGRQELLAGVGPGDVLITSWALLSRDVEELKETRWATVVFDEAQAMKNRSTRRNKAARALNVGFRVALTGTPLENHVGELHALLSVVAPGLLGSSRRFRERFAVPIGAGEVRASDALSRVVAPFLLRRLKAQVARELPARTEVQLAVDLSDDERELYDEVRRAALAQLELARELKEARRRFQALGMLTKLRQAACHPKLVKQDSQVPSSKLRRVLELLGELREEGHRALVFSQFVGHLQLVQEALQAEGFRLLYLDGSTPKGERGALVDRFQAGEADVFLISLKAGGTGLNLTAASYVVHLDPWWNPAAEDQATDRAHRIGQQQPVTVYRMVARGTVEDSIVALHARKREVAEQVLAGSGSTRSLGPDELMALILGEGEFEVPEVPAAGGAKASKIPEESGADGAKASKNPRRSGAGGAKASKSSKRSGADGAKASKPARAFGPAAASSSAVAPNPLRDLIALWTAELERRVAAGALTVPTQRSYARVAQDLLSWVEAHEVGNDLAAAQAALPRIRAAIEDGTWTGGRTIRFQGGLVLRQLQEFAEDAGLR